MEQLPETLPNSPLPLICKWLQDAVADGGLPNPDAMTLATVDSSGQPAARVVLCKDIVADPGYLIFYSNYESAKGAAIEANNRVAAVFHWDDMNRQVRIEGFALRSPAEESDSYFTSRDKESQIGAWASNQSEPVESRQNLLNKHAATARKLSGLAVDSGIMAIPRPPFWGGYRIWISAAELWVRGQARLHDRGRWERSLEFADPANPKPGAWTTIRLQP
jgi:pyridoxamine 5'-phosphate oxidase